MQTLYQIQTAYLDLLAQLEASLAEDTLTPEQLDALNLQLEIQQAEFAEKADAYAAVIGQKRARVDFLKAEAKRLLDMARTEDATADRLQDRIAAAMVQQGLSKADTAHYKLSFRKSTAVEVSGPAEALPANYQRTKLVHEADKAALKTALLAGYVIPGAALVERQSLQIR